MRQNKASADSPETWWVVRSLKPVLGKWELLEFSGYVGWGGGSGPDFILRALPVGFQFSFLGSSKQERSGWLEGQDFSSSLLGL